MKHARPMRDNYRFPGDRWLSIRIGLWGVATGLVRVVTLGSVLPWWESDAAREYLKRGIEAKRKAEAA